MFDEIGCEPEAIPGDVESFLRMMTCLTTSTPTLGELVAMAACSDLDQAAAIDRLDAAMALGLVDASDDCGPDTLFTISTLGAEKLGVRLTFDSRRWTDRRTGRLIGPHDPNGRYRSRRPDTSPDLSTPLHQRVDTRQYRPDEILAIQEAERKPFDGDNPLNAPNIHRFYGIGAIWEGEEVISGTCPYCHGEVLGLHAYCLKCHNAGADRFLTKPDKSRRKQMPKSRSNLKGGV